MRLRWFVPVLLSHHCKVQTIRSSQLYTPHAMPSPGTMLVRHGLPAAGDVLALRSSRRRRPCSSSSGRGPAPARASASEPPGDGGFSTPGARTTANVCLSGVPALPARRIIYMSGIVIIKMWVYCLQNAALLFQEPRPRAASRFSSLCPPKTHSERRSSLSCTRCDTCLPPVSPQNVQLCES